MNKRNKWIGFMLSLVLLFNIAPIVSADSESSAGEGLFEFIAIEDAYVDGETNRGNAKTMKVKRTSTENRDAFIKFDISSFTGKVDDAQLKLYVTKIDSNSLEGYEIDVRGINDNSWDELTITTSTAPAEEGEALDTAFVGEDAIGTYISLNVTSFVQARADDIITLRLRGVTTGKGADYASKDDADLNKPPLLVIKEKPTVTLEAVEDAWVEGTTARGTLEIMKIKRTSSENRDAFIKFELPAYEGVIDDAKLQLFVKKLEGGTPDGYWIDVRGIEDDSWNELDIVASNAPADAGVVADTAFVGPEQVGTYITLDVTSFVRTQTDGILTLRLRGVDQSRGAEFVSKDDTTLNKPPLLVFTTTEGQPPAAPSDLAAQAGDQKISLTWSEDADATSYNIYRSLIDGGPYELIQEAVTELSFVDNSVVNKSVYYYVISAVNPFGESEMSTQVSAMPDKAFSIGNIVFTDLFGQVMTELANGKYVETNVEFTNETNEAHQAVLTVILYKVDEHKQLLVEDIVHVNQFIEAGRKQQLTAGFSIPNDGGEYILNLLAWDSIAGKNLLSEIVVSGR